MYLLGYIPADNRLYLGDKELNVVSYSLLLSVLEYQTAVMRKDFDTADKVGNIFFAQSLHFKLVSPQAAQLSLFYGKFSSVAPPLGT